MLIKVIKALTSLKSRGYVKEQFAWRHFYWYLTNEGILKSLASCISVLVQLYLIFKTKNLSINS